MYAHAESSSLRLAEVIGALSYALDLTEGQPPGHSLRSCWIGMHVGIELGLSEPSLADLFYTLLLKDAGCSSNAARMCELFGADDIETKRAVKTVDLQSLRQHGAFVLRSVAPDEPLRRRLGRILHLARHGDDLATELYGARCERGAQIARKLGFGDRVAEGITGLDEHWNGKGKPLGLGGAAIPLASRIALLAQVVDVFHTESGSRGARIEVRKRSGRWFDPTVVEAFERVSDDVEFWRGLSAYGLEPRVMALEPRQTTLALDDHRLDDIAEGFGQVIDAKSPFTAGHSLRVAELAVRVADRLGLGESPARWIRRASLLHDIGKLGISNTILDKPGRLDAEEWAQIQTHPLHTHRILSRIAPFRDLAVLAGAHHERLDGKGYPWGLKQDDIAIETRIVTVADIYDALTSDRPYREAMPRERAVTILSGMRSAAVDGDCLDALLAELEGHEPPARPLDASAEVAAVGE